MFLNPETQISLKRNENDSSLELSMYQDIGCPFKIKSKLLKGSEQLFFERITCQLLKIIQDLLLSESELSEEIKRKDDEIFVYKSKGKEITLRSVKTKEFIEDIHKRNHKMFDTFFGQSGVPQITMPSLEDNEIDIKEEAETSEQMKVETKQRVKIETEANENVPSCVDSYGTMNSVSVDNIKQETSEGSQSMPGVEVKRRKKGIKL